MDSLVWTETDSGRDEGRGGSDGVMDSRGSSRQGKMERERRLLDKPETRVLPVCCPC